MGWTYTTRPKGLKTRDWLIQQRVLDANRIKAFRMKKNVAYVAYEVGKNDKSAVLAVVVKISRSKNKCGWKSMDETMGPYIYDCPAQILDSLDPIEEVARKLGLGASVQDRMVKWRHICYSGDRK